MAKKNSCQAILYNFCNTKLLRSGNLLRHPAFEGYSICTERETPNVCTLHKNGLYVGNSQFVNKKMIAELFITLRSAV